MNTVTAKLVSAPEPQHQAPASAHVAPQKKLPVRRIVMSGVLVAALLAAGYYGYNWFQLGRFQISTDDAYVKTDMSQLGTKISGYVVELPVAENTSVKAGDVIAKLDAGDYKLAVDAAQARIETQKTTLATIAQQAAAQTSQIDAAKAQLLSAQAVEINAVKNQNRASQLVKSNVGTQQDVDNATSQRATAEAGVNVAEANLAAAIAQTGIFNAQSVGAQSTLNELQIALEQAQHNLSFTEIKAPFDGVVANRSAQLGQYVSPGTILMALVPVQDSYIEANFKETQIAEMHPGQKAEITVDAFGSEKYEGKVESLSPASGAEFSLLPPENATGNFTKITQRMPVKIILPPELAAKMRPGLSAVVTVDLRDKGDDAQ